MGQSILANTAVASIGRVATSLLGFVSLGLLSRLLGVEGFGVYSLILAYGAIILIVADGGLYLSLTRLIAAHPNEKAEYVSQVVGMRGIALALAFALGLTVSRYVPELQDYTLIIALAALGFASQSVSQLIMSIFQAYGTIWKASVGDVFGRVVQVALLLLAGPAQISLAVAGFVFAASAGVTTITHRLLLPQGISLRPSFSYSKSKRIFSQSWPLGLLLLLNTIYFRIDTLILAMFHSSAQVGVYALAYRVVESGLFFPAMFGGLILPRISHALAEQKHKVASRLYSQGLVLLAWVALGVVVITSTSSREIITLLAGADYLDSASILAVLGLALAAMIIGNLNGFTLVATEQQKSMLMLAGSLAVFNTVANVIFIPKFGAGAAAWTTVITEGIAVLVGMWLVMGKLHISISGNSLLRIAIVGALSSFAAYYLPATQATAGALIHLCIVASLYLALTILVRPFGMQDVHMLTRKPYAD